MAKNGAWYHEPPYTWEGSRDFYRALSGGPVTFVHPPVLAKAEAPQIAAATAGRMAPFADALNSRGVSTAGGGSCHSCAD
jgi:hypothetical protein